ncbi:MAG: cell division protein FtsZ [Bacteroidales bacterium]|nr:cell division protein FtsZ [Bacteroidales bacterium]MDD5975258.1 cell division protein FtsZ [Bacteroidales bacterium]MDY5193414.1 cell division protein FtsZ [Candidatus Aphodosoma sp.]
MEGIIDNLLITKRKSPLIKVVGVGGGGGNTVNFMYENSDAEVSYVVMNTDSQALESSPIPNKLLLGPNITEGLGAGANPSTAEEAAMASKDDIKKILDDGAKMVFITAGMGGGTGTGAAPIVAEIAKDQLGMLTIGIVTIPFALEGNAKIRKALRGISKLSKNVDALLIINNERIADLYPEYTIQAGFAKADSVLSEAATSIANLILKKGYINLDFADVKTTLKNGGVATINTGKGSGENRVALAIDDAMKVPLLNNSKDITKAKRLLLNFYCSKEKAISMREHRAITDFVNTMDRDNVEVIYGFTYDDSLDEEVQLTLLATLDISPVPADIEVNIDDSNSAEKNTKEENEKYNEWMKKLYNSDLETGNSIVSLEELENPKILSEFKKPSYLRK